MQIKCRRGRSTCVWGRVWQHLCRCSNWKNPPLEKTLPFTGAQSLCLEISNSEGGAQKNGYYQDVPWGKMYDPDLKPMCDLDLNTILFGIKNPYRRTKKLLQARKILTGAQILQARGAPVRVFCAPVRIFDLK